MAKLDLDARLIVVISLLALFVWAAMHVLP